MFIYMYTAQDGEFVRHILKTTKCDEFVARRPIKKKKKCDDF